MPLWAVGPQIKTTGLQSPPFGLYLASRIPAYWLPMFELLRTATVLGLLPAGVPTSLSSQATGSGALPPAQQARQTAKSVQTPAAGIEVTGSQHPALLDEKHRPITAGGFVKNGPIVFIDDSEKAKLTQWTHKMGTPEKGYIIETKGSGVGLIDFDNDGWLDIYVVNGSTVNALDGKETPPHAALFRNNHDGTFTDVAEKAGVQLGNWSTGATWGDYDGDGRLDLFVAGYIHWDRNNLPNSKENGGNNAFCNFRGEAVACGPRGLQGEPDHLFHNNGDGTFTDVSEKAGVADNPGY